MFGLVFFSRKGNVFKDYKDINLLTMVVGTSKLGLTSKLRQRNVLKSSTIDTISREI